MHRLILVPATLALLGLGTVTGSAAPMDRHPVVARAPAITLVEGWWEQENRNDAPDRYWRLKPADRRRYDQVQARIERRHRQYHLDQYDHRDNRDLAEQHRLLRYR